MESTSSINLLNVLETQSKDFGDASQTLLSGVRLLL